MRALDTMLGILGILASPAIGRAMFSIGPPGWTWLPLWFWQAQVASLGTMFLVAGVTGRAVSIIVFVVAFMFIGSILAVRSARTP